MPRYDVFGSIFHPSVSTPTPFPERPNGPCTDSATTGYHPQMVVVAGICVVIDG